MTRRIDRPPPPTSAPLPAAVVTRLPEAAADYVGELLSQHPVVLRVVPRRVTKLGDHRPPNAAVPWHRITINDDLNPYAFLVTLLHELAHLTTHAAHGGRCRRLQPHGREWQTQFATVIEPVVAQRLVPADIDAALRAAVARPRAATCSDRRLLLALSRYDADADSLLRVEELRPGDLFELESGRRFIRGARLRSRYRCLEASSGVEYRVHGLARVARVPPD
jgi:SprT protein